jgi:hypothetical protein
MLFFLEGQERIAGLALSIQSGLDLPLVLLISRRVEKWKRHFCKRVRDKNPFTALLITTARRHDCIVQPISIASNSLLEIYEVFRPPCL